MGLEISVGLIADLRESDPESAEEFAQVFSNVGRVLKVHGLPQHVEPLMCESRSWGMFGYAGLHYLRRIAAHLDAGLPLPPPGQGGGASDPLLQAYGEDVLGKKPALMQRLFNKPPRFARSFDHLIVHSDAEGFYLPQDFPNVLFADEAQVPGGILGSTPRLLAELERLAQVIGVPESLQSDSEDLWEAVDAHGEGEARWQKYGIESYSCVVLREACRKSLESGAAIVFH
ncbi:hypothetical protein [Xanthomonas sp. 3075]|uniref:hypothetical protein n=1 Tax=Xanthomonas sp. 3075 TaxID=3035315 RepID=UPI001613CEA8|nr:hypothetical protein [Xanthomonas sp. 3075]MBB4133014.1 hypothetical protein [Xanthomonas sp. 3075]